MFSRLLPIRTIMSRLRPVRTRINMSGSGLFEHQQTSRFRPIRTIKSSFQAPAHTNIYLHFSHPPPTTSRQVMIIQGLATAPGGLRSQEPFGPAARSWRSLGFDWPDFHMFPGIRPNQTTVTYIHTPYSLQPQQGGARNTLSSTRTNH